MRVIWSGKLDGRRSGTAERKGHHVLAGLHGAGPDLPGNSCLLVQAAVEAGDALFAVAAVGDVPAGFEDLMTV